MRINKTPELVWVADDERASAVAVLLEGIAALRSLGAKLCGRFRNTDGLGAVDVYLLEVL